MELIDRFINYTKVHTKSSEESTSHPSTERQKDLAKILVNELKELGLSDAFMADGGVVYAHLKSNTSSTLKIGFIAHMDTSPEATGENVKPQIIKNYDGKTIILKDGITIDPLDFPRLKDQIGHTLITTDGTTLLGADDKAGIAEIMSMLEYIIKNNIPHHNISVAFTPDEEIGEGTATFDLETFDADFAYTVDGGKYDEFSYECFNASAAKIDIVGVGIHPGEAKGKMVNAARIGIEFDTLLPDNMRPEYTSGYEGFNHLTSISGDEVHTTLRYILRSFDKNEIALQKETFNKIKEFLTIKYPKAKINIEFKNQYENMRYILDNHKDVINLAIDAMKKEGITPILDPIRGGTDGARLTYLGLPTPNLPTGGYNYHGVREYASYDEMIICMKYLINIASL